MALKPVTDRIWILSGFANMYLLDAPEGMTLIDTGLPNSESKVFDALKTLGRAPTDLKHIIATHAHFDHIGSFAALAKASGARTYIHTADVGIAERGEPFRPMGPGLLPRALLKLLIRPGRFVTPTRIDVPFNDGDVLPLAGGLHVVHAPGHCAGEVVLLWPEGRVLFVGDVCINIFGLRPPIGYEDRAEGERSQRKVAALDFDIACFGHGPPIVGGASNVFRAKYG